MSGSQHKGSRIGSRYAAGIALARWYFGHPADSIEIGVAIRAENPRREVLSDERMVVVYGSPIAPANNTVSPDLEGADLEWHRRCGRVLAETELVVLATGYRASFKRYGQVSVDSWRRRNASDYERAVELTGSVDGDPMLALEMACLRARALLTAPSFSGAIHWLAREFFERGRLSMKEIHETCSNYLCGLGPARATWSQSWTPTLEQLQDAHIPYLDIFEEDLIDRTYEAHQALGSKTG